MHSNVTIKNVSWLHFSWATLYIVFGALQVGLAVNCFMLFLIVQGSKVTYSKSIYSSS